jgi:hypothetical protein
LYFEAYYSMAGSAYPEIPATAVRAPGTRAAEDDIRVFLEDLAHRKELYATRSEAPADEEETKAVAGFKQRPPDGRAETRPLQLDGFQLHGAQRFMYALFTPDTPYPRMLLKWGTGRGKTSTMLKIAQEFVRRFTAQRVRSGRGAVFVVGFTRRIILQEMMKYPELGFVTRTEAARLHMLRAVAHAAGLASQEARTFGAYVGTLGRRIRDAARGGQYVFLGYKEFAASLLRVTPKGAAAGTDMLKLYRAAAAQGKESFGAVLQREVRKGHVDVDTGLLDRMRGGLLVCDEFHDVYNMQDPNNYGVAIKYALDALELEDNAPRAIFMTATPCSGSAKEVVDLLNLLIPHAHLRRADFFSNEVVGGASLPGGSDLPRFPATDDADEFFTEALADIDLDWDDPAPPLPRLDDEKRGGALKPTPRRPRMSQTWTPAPCPSCGQARWNVSHICRPVGCHS